MQIQVQVAVLNTTERYHNYQRVVSLFDLMSSLKYARKKVLYSLGEQTAYILFISVETAINAI